MGTEFRIILYTSEERDATAAARAAFQCISRLDSALSDYRPDSEIMRLCANAGGPPVRVSDDLFQVLFQAQELALRTAGAFDVTVGPVVRIWRRARRQKQLPDAIRLENARKLVGFDKMKLDETDRTVELTLTGMQIDLGGIAKGYAADAATRELKSRGIVRSLVAAGGDIVITAPPPQASGWTIGIAPPDRASKPPREFLMLRDAAISTSGDTEQFLELDGRRYSHVIDPRNGEALTSRFQVTVIARNGATADSVATAVSVLGVAAGLELVDSMRDTSVQIVRGTEVGTEIHESPRFRHIPRTHEKRD